MLEEEKYIDKNNKNTGRKYLQKEELFENNLINDTYLVDSLSSTKNR